MQPRPTADTRRPLLPSPRSIMVFLLKDVAVSAKLLPRHERNALQVRLSSLTLSLVRLESLTYFLAGVTFYAAGPQVTRSSDHTRKRAPATGKSDGFVRPGRPEYRLCAYGVSRDD